MSSIPVRSAKGLLTLTALRGVGPITAEKLARRYEFLEDLFAASSAELRSVAPKTALDAFSNPLTLTAAKAKADAVLERCERAGISVTCVFDALYPKAYQSLSDRPPVLFFKGNLERLERSVACIGTREPSPFGVKVSESIAEQLALAKWTVVSGLALGVDALCHAAALKYGGRTVAILGGGLDSIYPKANTALAEEILGTDGALISEQPPGAPAAPSNLIQRDRLQSGLSIGTCVMQTDIKGGSMHTVRYTLMQHRLLFAPVPAGRHAEDPKSRGILALTQKSGAAFAEAIGAEGEYRKMLVEAFATRPVAFPLESRDDFTQMLARLDTHAPDAALKPEAPEVPMQSSMF